MDFDEQQMQQMQNLIDARSAIAASRLICQQLRQSLEQDAPLTYAELERRFAPQPKTHYRGQPDAPKPRSNSRI